MVFSNHKRIIRIIMEMGIRDLCRKYFKILNIFPLISQYIFSLLFVVNYKCHFRMNFEIHNINTRQISDCSSPLLHLTIYQRGQFYMGIKLYKCFPTEIKYLSNNTNKFKLLLRSFLHQHSLYTMDKY